MKAPGLGMHKSMAGQEGPKSLTATVLSNFSVLAVHKVWCGEDRFPI